eukprot:m.1252942 g.1252942  ORF g.1252942 m.1252942 type:complete len:59 (+) comp24704_c0_seq1:2578-2754(+)
MLKFNWLGHQSRFDVPLPLLVVNAPCITGHFPSDAMVKADSESSLVVVDDAQPMGHTV